MKKVLVVFMLTILASGCSSWVYKYDINQGNFLNQRDVDKLRINMTKEQVEYVLGSALITNPFKDSDWHYVYTRRVGKTDEFVRKELVVHFNEGRLVKISGDFEEPEEFNQSLDE